MKFYNRETELKILRTTENLSKESSVMTFITGRRRIGKTRLIKEAFKDRNLLYFFVSKKSEKLLCEEYSSIIENTLNTKVIGKLQSFKDVFEYIMMIGREKQINLALDEFQEFKNINPSVYSEIQNIWDSYKEKSKVNLVLSGSIYSIMHKIFEDKKEPLYGRADKKIILGPFDVNTLKRIYKDYEKFNPYDFISFYAITGGIAKYVELLCKQRALKFDKMIEMVIDDGSFFLNEGRDVLVDEFGKDYHIYFSILSLIASSKTSRSEIESILEKSVGGYLENLEKEYMLIKKMRPAFAKEKTKNVKYVIDDNFLNFWFRFIYKNSSAIEIKNFNYVRKYVKRDFNTFLGKILEKYFKEKLMLSDEFSYIGSYWDRKGENEIDIIALNEIEKRALLAEVKLDKSKINLKILKKKAEKVLPHLKGYKIEYKGFGLGDV